MSDTCGFTVYDGEGEEQPCDRPATGWRWYQGHDHEDALDVACRLHENEGGRRIHAAETELAELRSAVVELAPAPQFADEPCTETRCSAQAHPASEGHIVRESASTPQMPNEGGELERLRAEVEGQRDLANMSIQRATRAEAALTRVRKLVEALEFMGNLPIEERPDGLTASVKACTAIAGDIRLALDGAE